MRFPIIYDGPSWPFLLVPAGVASLEAAIIYNIPHVSWFIPPVVASLTFCACLGYYLWRFRHGYYLEVNSKGIRQVVSFLTWTLPYERLVSVQLSPSGRVKLQLQRPPALLRHLPPERHHYEVIERLGDARSFETALRLRAPSHVRISWSPSLPEEEEAYVFEATAGFLRRATAFALDAIMSAVLWMCAWIVLFMPLFVADISVDAAWLFPILPVVWFLYTWEGNARGQSEGKSAMKLRVQALPGAPPGLWPGLRRTMGQFAIGLTLGIGYLWVLTNHERRGLHDILAGTRVVRGVKRQASESEQRAADLALDRQNAISP